MLSTVFKKGDNMGNNLEPKRVKVSKQRQISIPKDFYDKLNFEDEAVIEISNNTLIIRPSKNENVDFSEFILSDLIAEGYSGDNLLKKFKEIKKELPNAMDRLSQEALNNKPFTGDVSLDEFLDEDEDV